MRPSRSTLRTSIDRKGAYVLAEPAEVGLQRKPQAVIIATGSEVQLALQRAAGAGAAENGIAVRVVSMPSTTVFDRQGAAYKSEVLPAGVPRIAVEMGVTDGWWKYGCAAVVGIDTLRRIGARRRRCSSTSASRRRTSSRRSQRRARAVADRHLRHSRSIFT